MTLDKLATMTQAEFRAIRSEMATKEDLKAFATKGDLRDLKEEIVGEVRSDMRSVIESNDRVITDKLHDHDGRIKKLEDAKTR